MTLSELRTMMDKSDMSPCSAFADMGYHALGRFERGCDIPYFVARLSESAYLRDVFFRKSSPAVSGALPVPVSVAPLSVHVSNIVAGSPTKQVVWANASRVIAMVANHVANWYRAIVKLPRQSVCINIVAAPSRPDTPVSFSNLGTSPKPTLVGLRHLPPKPDLYRCSFPHIGMIPQ